MNTFKVICVGNSIDGFTTGKTYDAEILSFNAFHKT